MIRSLPLFLVTTLLGCGSGVVVAPPKPATQAGGLGTIEISAAAVPVGEHLKAEAEVLGLNVGRLDVSTTKPCTAVGADHVTIEAKLSTAGMLRFFNKTEGVATTEVDPVNFRTLRSTTHVDDGEEWREYKLRFKPGTFSYTYTKSSGEKKRGTKPVPDAEPVYDTQSAVSLLRSWRPKAIGEKSYFYVVIGRQLWRADVSYRGPKEIDVRKKRTKTLLFDGVAHRVDLNPKEEYTPRHFAVWLADEPSRLPVQVSGDGSIGAVTFYLQSSDKNAPCKAPTEAELAALAKKQAQELAEKEAAAATEKRAAKKQKPKRKRHKRKATDPLEPAVNADPNAPAPPPAVGAPETAPTTPPPVTNEPVWTRDPTGTAEPIL